MERCVCVSCKVMQVRDGHLICDRCSADAKEEEFVVVARVYIEGYGRKDHAEKTIETLRNELKLKFGPRARADLEVLLKGDEARIDE